MELKENYRVFGHGANGPNQPRKISNDILLLGRVEQDLGTAIRQEQSGTDRYIKYILQPRRLHFPTEKE
jgi:hypothetical protein